MTSTQGGDPRTYREKLIDRLMLLHLYDRVSSGSKMTGDVKLQKLVFLSEKDMLERDWDGLNYKFFRWDLGPMSKGVYEDHDFLYDNGLISESGGLISESGHEILENAEGLLDENVEIVSVIDDVVDEYGHIGGGRLKNIVYDEEVTLMGSGKSMKVENIPEATDIIFKLPEEHAELSFNISDDWVETLDLLFQSESRELIARIREGAQENPSQLFEPAD